MPDADKIEEFLDKLKPCIDKGELDACVDECVGLAKEMGIGAEKLVNLSGQNGESGNHELAYVLALVAVQGMDGKENAGAYLNAAVAAQFNNKLHESEKYYNRAIELNPKFAEAYKNYATLLILLYREDEAEEYFKKAIEL